MVLNAFLMKYSTMKIKLKKGNIKVLAYIKNNLSYILKDKKS